MKRPGMYKLALFISILVLTGISCGVSEIGGLFATPTPTATATLTPTATFTPSPTATFTPTSTPTATPLPSGVTSEEQADGATLFIDYDKGYKLSLPKGWIVIPLDKDGLAEILDKVSEDNPDLAETAQAFRDLDPAVFRMAALYADPSLVASGFGTNITVTAFEDNLMSGMPLSFITGVLEQSFIDNGGKVLTQGVNIIENDNGVEIEYIDVEQTADGLKLVQRLVVFKSGKTLIALTITVPAQFKDEVLTVSDAIGGSIEYLE